MYWTQKASSNARQGRTIRAGIDIPDGDTTPERRRDVAVIFKDLPEPIDLELDLAKRTTDRGDPPLGNTVNRAPMVVAAGDAPRVLLGDLQEAIGVVLDLTNRQVFFTDLGGPLSDLSPTQTKYGRCRNRRCPLGIETIRKMSSVA
jgi:hypothetical protein